MKKEDEAYASKFPSAWLGQDSISPSCPADSAPTQDQRLQPCSNQSDDETLTGSQSLHSATNSPGHGESDIALESSAQPRLSVSTRATSHRDAEDEKNPASDEKQSPTSDNADSHQPRSKSPATATPAHDYTTVYPASWTVPSTKNTRQMTPNRIPQTGMPPKVTPLSTEGTSARSISSTASQGDVGPLSPNNRRLKREFLSMSHPSPRAQAREPPRATSVDASSSRPNLLERFFGAQPKPKPMVFAAPAKLVPQIPQIPQVPNLAGRHASSNSNYSTIDRDLSMRERSQTDYPARRANVSTTYSAYNDS